MKKRILLLVLATLTALLFTGCAMRTVEEMYALPKRSEEFNEMQSAIDTAMYGMTYASPHSGENQQTVQMADLDGDGFMEAVTLGDDRGLTVYTDADGDGTVDHVSTVRFDGSYDSWRLANPTEGVPFGGFVNEAREDGGEGSPVPARWERIDHGHI